MYTLEEKSNSGFGAFERRESNPVLLPKKDPKVLFSAGVRRATTFDFFTVVLGCLSRRVNGLRNCQGQKNGHHTWNLCFRAQMQRLQQRENNVAEVKEHLVWYVARVQTPLTIERRAEGWIKYVATITPIRTPGVEPGLPAEARLKFLFSADVRRAPRSTSSVWCWPVQLSEEIVYYATNLESIELDLGQAATVKPMKSPMRTSPEERP
ncbi:hypothetical protein B0H16DRAFT_1477971 [Mycena metata]|uniref:Uncharacterized protein n=1 Tax=Mycena metata TaxID=1033252 RepID=A0AAD7H7R2_9AGAR|nr:hypothetical protein B0H16DRAFT_1477971 [Mycena metata]